MQLLQHSIDFLNIDFFKQPEHWQLFPPPKEKETISGEEGRTDSY